MGRFDTEEEVGDVTTEARGWSDARKEQRPAAASRAGKGKETSSLVESPEGTSHASVLT